MFPLEPESGPARSVTIKDIALRAGVSVPSVSLVLNGKAGHFRTATRERVLRVASELGYRRNVSARNLRVGRFDSVLLLSGMKRHLAPLVPQLVEGVESVLHSLNKTLVLGELPDDELSSESVMSRLIRQTMTDGLLINYHHAIPQKLVEFVIRHSIPSVWVNALRETDCVYPDDYGGASGATRAYLDRGLTRIAYADYNHSQTRTAHYSASDRYHGYLEAMSKAGHVPKAVFNRNPQVAQVLDRVRLAKEDFFTGRSHPEAVICYSHATAMNVLFAALAAGLSVPKQIRIAAFSVDILARVGCPIDTIPIPLAEVGTAAAESILKRVESPQTTLPAQPIAFTTPLRTIEQN